MMKDLYVIESDKESENEEFEKPQHTNKPLLQNVDSGGGELDNGGVCYDINTAVNMRLVCVCICECALHPVKKPVSVSH